MIAVDRALSAGFSERAVSEAPRCSSLPLTLAILVMAASCERPAPEAIASSALVSAAAVVLVAAETRAAGITNPGLLPQPGSSPESPPWMTLIAGGDVSFGRLVGQILLREPDRELFSTLAPLLASADVRFCNLESLLSDQRGETESPRNNLVFTGPPAGADALARAGFTVVSTANNHAWDYGKKALFETMDNLMRVGVRYVGTGRNREEAYRPVFIDARGVRLAMIAVTDIWNDGALWSHPAVEHVAGADTYALPAAVRSLRADKTVDVIAVSYHGLAEYMNEPLPRTRELLRGAIDAGADVVIGHHPHVIHGVEWRRGRPILYSLGNLLMRMNRHHPWTEMGYLARVRLARGEPPLVEACPFRIHGIVPLPFAGDPSRAAYERSFFAHLEAISKTVGGTTVSPAGADGCAALSAIEPSLPRD